MTVSVRVCQPSLSSPGAGTVGTAALPTVTPTPASPRQPDAIKSGVASFYADAVPIAGLANDSSLGTDSRLTAALTVAEATTALNSHAARLWELCSATALLPDVPEAAPAAQSLRTALLERTAWLTSAAEQLRCCGFAGIKGIEERRRATTVAFESARKEIVSLAALYGVNTATLPTRKEVTNAILALSVETPAGWVIMDNSAQVVLLAPGDTQSLVQDTLGPKQWELGTALRIRRLRNPSALDLNAAVTRAQTLLEGLGSLRGERSVTVAGLSAVEQTRMDESAGWQVKVVIAVRGEFTYFFESGSPLQGSDAEFDQTLATVKFRN